MSTPPFVFVVDADAFIALRALGVLDAITQSAAAATIDLVLTGYIATHDLSSLSTTINALCQSGHCRVEKVTPSSVAGQMFRGLRKKPCVTKSGKPVHKGEQEAVCWLVSVRPDATFESADAGAIDLARDHGIRAGDVLAFVCDLVVLGILNSQSASQLLTPWEDRVTGLGRPKEYPGIPTALVNHKRP